MSGVINLLLKRQLKRLGLSAEGPPPSADLWPQLLDKVSRAYTEAEDDRYLLERSQEVASNEMNALNAELRTAQGRLKSLVSLSSDWVWEQDADLRFTYFSHQHPETASFDPTVLQGTRCMGDEAYSAPHDEVAAFNECVNAHKPFREFTFGYTDGKGKRHYLRISGEPIIEFGEFQGYRGVGTDVTKTRLAEEKVAHLASFDGLTSLPNRRSFINEVGPRAGTLAPLGRAVRGIFHRSGPLQEHQRQSSATPRATPCSRWWPRA